MAQAAAAAPKAVSNKGEHIAGTLAREVIVPFLPSTTLLFDGVTFTVPKRGEKLELLEFSQKSARIYRAEQLKNLEIKNPERYTERLMNALQKELRLDRQPRHIECFDNSNLQGAHPVASRGVPRRKTRAQGLPPFQHQDRGGPRRLRFDARGRLPALQPPAGGGAELPDLIIADGGRGRWASTRCWSISG